MNNVVLYEVHGSHLQKRSALNKCSVLKHANKPVNVIKKIK